MKYDFAGYDTDITTSWEEKYEELYNEDGSLVLISKETFHYDDPDSDLRFEYRIAFSCVDMYSRCGEDTANYVVISLYMVPEPKYWVDSFASFCGLENIPRSELLATLNVQYAIAFRYAIPLENDSVHYNLKEYDAPFDVLKCEEAVRKINAAASILDDVNNLRKFSLNAIKNCSEYTNWETLKHALHGTD